MQLLRYYRMQGILVKCSAPQHATNARRRSRDGVHVGFPCYLYGKPAAYSRQGPNYTPLLGELGQASSYVPAQRVAPRCLVFGNDAAGNTALGSERCGLRCPWPVRAQGPGRQERRAGVLDVGGGGGGLAHRAAGVQAHGRAGQPRFPRLQRRATLCTSSAPIWETAAHCATGSHHA